MCVSGCSIGIEQNVSKVKFNLRISLTSADLRLTPNLKNEWLALSSPALIRYGWAQKSIIRPKSAYSGGFHFLSINFIHFSFCLFMYGFEELVRFRLTSKWPMADLSEFTLSSKILRFWLKWILFQFYELPSSRHCDNEGKDNDFLRMQVDTCQDVARHNRERNGFNAIIAVVACHLRESILITVSVCLCANGIWSLYPLSQK